LRRRYERRFVAFAPLRLDGEDIAYVLLMGRKARLRAMVSKRSDSLKRSGPAASRTLLDVVVFACPFLGFVQFANGFLDMLQRLGAMATPFSACMLQVIVCLLQRITSRINFAWHIVLGRLRQERAWGHENCYGK